MAGVQGWIQGKGYEIGYALYKEFGARKMALEVAAKFLANGTSMECVAEIVDMSVEELTDALAKPLDQD